MRSCKGRSTTSNGEPAVSTCMQEAAQPCSICDAVRCSGTAAEHIAFVPCPCVNLSHSHPGSALVLVRSHIRHTSSVQTLRTCCYTISRSTCSNYCDFLLSSFASSSFFSSAEPAAAAPPVPNAARSRGSLASTPGTWPSSWLTKL